MTTAELARDIGKQAEVTIPGGLTIIVTIQDARQVWGRIDYLVAPVYGSGSTWVSSERVSRFFPTEAATDSCPWCAEPVDPTDGFFCYQCKP